MPLNLIGTRPSGFDESTIRTVDGKINYRAARSLAANRLYAQVC